MYIGNQGKIMRKLLGKPNLESTPDHSLGVTSSPLPTVFRPSASQDAVYAAGSPIACLDKSPDGRSAVLAGRHILKTLKFDGLNIREGVDVRALITAQPANRGTATSSTSDQLSIRDVKWASGQNGATIFTACANGKIFHYDLGRLGTATPGGTRLDCIQMREDSRQINTLDINPHRGTYLLSGSQDGIVRFFDIRVPIQTRIGLTFRAGQAFKCNADGVRRVRWSPKDGFFFACGTEQGVVLKWDIRKAAAPILRINGHDKACTSVSWHPDGEHLISGGWDNKCHVWDMSRNADKRQKPKYTISTPAHVAAVQWRPGQWSATTQGKRAAQVAVSYEESSHKKLAVNAVHIWDLARPTMPYKEICRFDSSPAAILWHDQDLLWTGGQDGLFSQCDVAFAPKVIDRTLVSTMAFSARGEALMFLDERPQSKRHRIPLIHPEAPPTASYSSSPTTPMLSVSRSDSEDDVVGSFLGPRKRAGRRRLTTTRSTHALSTTPPSGPGVDDHIVPLEQALKMTGMYRHQQAMAIGPVPSAAKVDVYGYLSAVYLESLESELPQASGSPPLPERVAVILEHFAKAAENVSQFRLAQTWRILAYVMDLLLRRRAQYHLEKRMKRSRGRSPDFREWKGKANDQNPKSYRPVVNTGTGGEETPRKVQNAASLLEKPNPVRSLLAEEIESTSNVATPLARPISDVLADEAQHITDIANVRYIPGKKLTPVLEADGFTLPPAAHPLSIEDRRRLDSMPLSEDSQGSTQESLTEGYDFYDTEVLAKAIDVPNVKKKEPEVLAYVEPRSPPSQFQGLMRHDTDESLARMFSISQTSGQSTSSGGSISKKVGQSEPIAEQGTGSGSDVVDGEYQSRIRGVQMEESPGSSSRLSYLRRALERTTTNLTETTDEEYQTFTHTTDDSLVSRDHHSRSFLRNSQGLPQSVSAESGRGSDSSSDSNPDRVIETDYLPWADDPPYPHPIKDSAGTLGQRSATPLQPYTLLSRVLAFETRSSALNASAIILLLRPLVPDDIIDPFQAVAILRQHHARLMGMKLFVEAALLRNLCVRGWPGGDLSGWGENYTSIFSQAQHGVSAGFMCPECRKPREIDRTSKSTGTVWRCERCDSPMGPCAVCGHRETTGNSLPLHPASLAGIEAAKAVADTEPGLSTWWYCAGCGHGGHSTCLEGWHSMLDTGVLDGSPLIGSLPEPLNSDAGIHIQFSDGCCPMDGCGHACLPGRWRTESTAARSEEVTRVVREATRSVGKPSPLGKSGERDRRVSVELGVRGDGNEVGQSRAVETVRESLASDRDSSRILGSSPGRSSLGPERERERERRKSVKFAGTDERR